MPRVGAQRTACSGGCWSSRITTPSGAQWTAAEVIAGTDLSGRRAIVTGGASGIGVETARALAARAEVTLAGRNLAHGQAAAQDIIASTGHPQVRVGSLDLADPASVAAFAAGWRGPLDILVNNAGLMAAPLTRTRQGWEMQFATNHLGHFALANGLPDALEAAGQARVVVVVSSVGHLNGEVLFDDINFERHPYDPWAPAGTSRMASRPSPPGRAGGAAWPPTPWTTGRPRGCGRSRPTCWPATARVLTRACLEVSAETMALSPGLAFPKDAGLTM